MYREPEIKEYWLLINDLHVGSDIAPMPEGVEIENSSTGDVRTVTPSKTQEKLNKFFDEMTRNLPPLTGVLCNGDMCDGPNRKSNGRGNWTSDLRVQAKACAFMLEKINDRQKHRPNWYFTLGSEYHAVDDRPLDQAVCDLMGGTFGNDLIIKALKGDFRIHAHHYVSGGMGAWMYLTTPVAKDMMLMELNNAREEYGDVRWILRGHKHMEYGVRFGKKGGHVVPGWQGRTEFGIRKGMVSVPKIGYCILKIYDDGSANVVPFTKKLVPPSRSVEVSYE